MGIFQDVAGPKDLVHGLLWAALAAFVPWMVNLGMFRDFYWKLEKTWANGLTKKNIGHFVRGSWWYHGDILDEHDSDDLCVEYNGDSNIGYHFLRIWDFKQRFFMSDFHNFSAQKRGIFHPYDTLAVKQQGHHDFKLKTIGFWVPVSSHILFILFNIRSLDWKNHAILFQITYINEDFNMINYCALFWGDN